MRETAEKTIKPGETDAGEPARRKPRMIDQVMRLHQQVYGDGFGVIVQDEHIMSRLFDIPVNSDLRTANMERGQGACQQKTGGRTLARAAEIMMKRTVMLRQIDGAGLLPLLRVFLLP